MQHLQAEPKLQLVTLLNYPRLFFQKILQQANDKYFTALLILSGVAQAFSGIKQKHVDTNNSLPTTLMVIILGGALFGWIAIYFSAFLIRQFGKWLNGTASTKSIVRVIVYASIPTIIGLSIVMLKVALFGKPGLGTFDGRLDLDGGQSMLWLALGFVQILLALWSFILLIVGISEAQKFSKTKALINIFFPAILIGILLVAIVVLGSLK